MQTIYEDGWSYITRLYDIDLWVMKSRWAWPTFYGPVILLNILKTSCYLMDEHNTHVLYLWIMSQWDMTFDCIINVRHSDLYFMVQWFVISPEPLGSFGELIVKAGSVVHTLLSATLFKYLLLRNHLSSQSQVSYGASMGWGNTSLFEQSRSHDQDCRHAHLW